MLQFKFEKKNKVQPLQSSLKMEGASIINYV